MMFKSIKPEIAYRISSFKRRGVYKIPEVSGAAFIRWSVYITFSLCSGGVYWRAALNRGRR